MQLADVFITHCGLNSANESLYFGVPMVLFPQHSEQRIVADRVAELGIGIKLKEKKTKYLATAVVEVLANRSYYENAQRLSETFRRASGGSVEAVDVILAKISKKS